MALQAVLLGPFNGFETSILATREPFKDVNVFGYTKSSSKSVVGSKLYHNSK